MKKMVSIVKKKYCYGFPARKELISSLFPGECGQNIYRCFIIKNGWCKFFHCRCWQGHGATVMGKCSKMSSIHINHIHIAHTFHNSTIKLFLISTIKENVIKYYWSIINLLMSWRSSMFLLESLKVEGQTQNTISLLRRTM